METLCGTTFSKSSVSEVCKDLIEKVNEFKDVLIACMGGVLLAGIIMGLASAGLLGALSTLFSVG